MASKGKIISDIEDYVKSQTPNEARGAWYVGIAEDADQRLFNDHAVSKEKHKWIVREADSEATARGAESDLHVLGYDGASGGGSEKTVFVYAYLKNSNTVQ